MGLTVVRHLQPVLDGAVEGVGLHQLVHRLTAHVAGFHQEIEGLPRGAHAQRRIAPAPDELLGLREEFDLADAAAPELDVVADHGDLPDTAVGRRSGV